MMTTAMRPDNRGGSGVPDPRERARSPALDLDPTVIEQAAQQPDGALPPKFRKDLVGDAPGGEQLFQLVRPASNRK
ncbi:MAG: hypothetical protein ACYTGZ_14915 [Planctomycetota bacterium]|jgi:hypothetical protein